MSGSGELTIILFDYFSLVVTPSDLLDQLEPSRCVVDVGELRISQCIASIVSKSKAEIRWLHVLSSLLYHHIIVCCVLYYNGNLLSYVMTV